MFGTDSVARRRLKEVALGLGISFLALGGCIVEEGDKACGDNQVKVDGEGTEYCVCAPGFIIDKSTNRGCKPCGENEEVLGDACVCLQGFSRSSPTAACSMSALGASCTDDSSCGGDFPACVTDGSSKYCSTTGCTSSNDCDPGFVCHTDAAGSACKKAPAGYGQSCESKAECAGTGATYCDSFSSHSCLVECSKSSPCPGDWGCCNFGPSIVICVEPSALVDGQCAAGGTLVTP